MLLQPRRCKTAAAGETPQPPCRMYLQPKQHDRSRRLVPICTVSVLGTLVLALPVVTAASPLLFGSGAMRRNDASRDGMQNSIDDAPLLQEWTRSDGAGMDDLLVEPFVADNAGAAP